MERQRYCPAEAFHLQDLFDIIFCYFPITFTPPPNDPYGISSEQLQMSLRYSMRPV
jgi:DNA repair/transcription protein MET18/MMS19